MKRFTRLGAAVAAGMIATSLVAGTADYVPTAENVAARKAFAERRFGIFIHWGLYALFGQGEWYLRDGKLVPEEYAKSVGAFYPSKFDARAWAKAFKRAGAKYVTITSRHHDGFSLWPTKSDDGYNIANTPFKRDILGERTPAARRGWRSGSTIRFWTGPERTSPGKGPFPMRFRTAASTIRPSRTTTATSAS